MNGKSGVSDVTRKRVLEAADGSIRSNELARDLVAEQLHRRVHHQRQLRAFRHAGHADQKTPSTQEDRRLLCDGRDDPIREDYYVRTLLGRRVDGIIVTGKVTDPRRPIELDHPVPIISGTASRRIPRTSRF